MGTANQTLQNAGENADLIVVIDFVLGVLKMWKYAGVAQLVEYLLPKQGVAGSNPVTRSKIPQIKFSPELAVIKFLIELQALDSRTCAR